MKAASPNKYHKTGYSCTDTAQERPEDSLLFRCGIQLNLPFYKSSDCKIYAEEGSVELLFPVYNYRIMRRWKCSSFPDPASLYFSVEVHSNVMTDRSLLRTWVQRKKTDYINFN